VCHAPRYAGLDLPFEMVAQLVFEILLNLISAKQ
jgi:hypothetical protein